jgi:hypothetical protein
VSVRNRGVLPHGAQVDEVPAWVHQAESKSARATHAAHPLKADAARLLARASPRQAALREHADRSGRVGEGVGDDAAQSGSGGRAVFLLTFATATVISTAQGVPCMFAQPLIPDVDRSGATCALWRVLRSVS